MEDIFYPANLLTFDFLLLKHSLAKAWRWAFYLLFFHLCFLVPFVGVFLIRRERFIFFCRCCEYVYIYILNKRFVFFFGFFKGCCGGVGGVFVVNSDIGSGGGGGSYREPKKI
ncbi:hypothetical protein T440DRAFT_33702 [Plenodomus tracheiphilus IPT5]|uniref:Transmembrane protein n=1 Tax=Plenodomus tracheiphilus IPT5 TaxID=1408161 RepID=A0A6A7BE77_9PLEO|nr:hypothetical protein T440DRAFT_33702 [Plenodomus tracheiphilus IPT5]